MIRLVTCGVAVCVLASISLAACGGRSQVRDVRDVVTVIRTVTTVRSAPAASKPRAKSKDEQLIAANRAVIYRRLLYDQEGVGMLAKDIRRFLGAPDRIQKIGGIDIWYYGIDAYPGPTFQLSFRDGVVATINRY